jgi:citronellol/citronellal dehydrogenase
MAQSYQSIFRPDLFAGQVIFVTGGGSGIGRCTAHELASLGADVVVGGRTREALDQTASEISEAGGRCSVVEIDIRDADQVDAAIAQVVERHGRLDGLFNNAGGQFFAPIEQMSANAWRTVIDLNLNGTFLVSTAAHRHWMKDNGGAIVNMLADIWTGYPGLSHMSAARAGIENMALSMTLEWAEHDVRVNCVAPGTILSSGMVTYPAAVQQQTVDAVGTLPSGRLGTESEVSAAVVYLLSPAANHVRGETIRIDGAESQQKGRFWNITRPGGTAAYDGFPLRPDFSGTPFETLMQTKDED